MAKLTQKEFMDKLSKILGDRDDDEALEFIADCKDTITGEGDEWKTKYDEAVKDKENLDKEWRKKYKERFFSPDTSLDDKDNHTNNHNSNPANVKNDDVDDEQAKLEQAEKVRINDLFKPVD